MEKFRFFEHTADVEFEAYGSTWENVFENAALAASEVMTDTKKVVPQKKEHITVVSEDMESLLYDFLEKILVLHDAKNMVFSGFNVKDIRETGGGFSLDAEIAGEEFDVKRHESRSPVKAVTYFNMKLGESGKTKYAHVVLDI